MAAQKGKDSTRSLVQQVADRLRSQILDGTYAVGARLPTEAALMEGFGVSRTVIREAVATLRYIGLVEPRQGAGVFVLDHPAIRPGDETWGIDPGRASSVLEVLELRRVIEIEAAGLAAQRRSPAQEGHILEQYDALHRAFRDGLPTAEADFRFHLAIADATNNPRFRDFMTLLGAGLIPRHTFDAPQGAPGPDPDAAAADAEHGALLNAILAGDAGAARDAMQVHMDNSVTRYRNLLRRVPR
ncbi:FCD domain-containing protein [Pseudooceanicola sp. GBMRC 2024]|uniref:FCD domain-containing protein n=1 Tax=Pseudooceanicola albus TaxID=2692189 RepID=A0A6L7G5I2_9RHOB|nr:FadR/GntR family transcriptional regulator [Pseudooceanicola albus]MXN17913.1 FCD domain-containing protein [Pseudooceanicola albus]